jgi:type II secretory pathway pseudopilin PulG
MKRIPANRIWMAVAIAVVLVAILLGLRVAGSPVRARAQRLDAARLQAIETIGLFIDQHYTAMGRVPTQLQELNDPTRPALRLADVETGQPYEYRMLSDSTYEICARFSLPSEAAAAAPWVHGVGRGCFARSAQRVAGVASRPAGSGAP